MKDEQVNKNGAAKSAPIESEKIYSDGETISTYVFESPNRLFIEVSSAGKNHNIKIKNIESSKLIGQDVFNLADSAKRTKFANSLKNYFLGENDQKTFLETLLELSDKTDELINKDEKNQDFEIIEKETLSEILSDGRIIEALSTNRFAVYDPKTNQVEYQDFLNDNGTVFKPLNDSVTQDKLLVDFAEDYESEIELINLLENYIQIHYDLSERERKLSAYYILLTYVAERFYEIPYFHPIGGSGTGKSRFSETIVSACYRPVFVVSITEASLFRFLDEYKATLFIDEFNFNEGDTATLNQILNAGWSKSYSIPRTNKDTGKVEKFSPFGCKVIASYKKFNDDALESRCIEVRTKETTRDDIRFCNTGQIAFDALKLRRKLLMFRFKNLSRDFTKEVIQSEGILKAHKDDKGKFLIRPRLIQKATPLFALIQDEKLRKEFVGLLIDETRVAKKLSHESFEYEMASAIYEILFNRKSETIAERRTEYQFKVESGVYDPENFNANAKDGEICEALTVENIVRIINSKREEKDKKVSSRSFGKTLKNYLKLDTDRCWRDKDANPSYSKTCVIFDFKILSELFENYSLPVSTDFNCGDCGKCLKCLETKVVTLPQLNGNNTGNIFNCGNAKNNSLNNLNGSPQSPQLKSTETTETIKNSENTQLYFADNEEF